MINHVKHRAKIACIWPKFQNRQQADYLDSAVNVYFVVSEWDTKNNFGFNKIFLKIGKNKPIISKIPVISDNKRNHDFRSGRIFPTAHEGSMILTVRDAGHCLSTACPGLHQAEFTWQSCCEALCKHSEIAQGHIPLSTLSFRSHRTSFQYATLKANHITIISLNIAGLCRKISSQAEILMNSLAWLFQFYRAYLISDRPLIIYYHLQVWKAQTDKLRCAWNLCIHDISGTATLFQWLGLTAVWLTGLLFFSQSQGENLLIKLWRTWTVLNYCEDWGLLKKYFCGEVFSTLTLFLVSHDPSEIILIWWFADQEHFLIITNVENSCAA